MLDLVGNPKEVFSRRGSSSEITYLQSEGIDETSGISREESPRFKLYSSRAADVLK